MSTIGRRGPRETGWNWSRPPAGPRRPPPPPLLPLAGAALLLAAVTAALLAVWLSDSDSGGPPPPTITPTATSPATATATPSPTPLSSPTRAPSPTPTPIPTPQPEFSLAIWDGRLWQAKPDFAAAAIREGQALPFLLRLGDARPGISYATVHYSCKTLQFLTRFDRDSGSAPALAADGPGSVLPDSTVALPDDPGTTADDHERGRLSLWGGSFGALELAAGAPPDGCERSLTAKLLPAQGDLFLLWGGVVAPGAAESGLTVRIAVVTARGERGIEIAAAAIAPAP